MREIDVTWTSRGDDDGDPLRFDVVVREGTDETRHQVTLSRETYDKLTEGKYSPERCVRAAFNFLLEREPKEAILRSFDITVIPGYFPSFTQEFHAYLTSTS